MKKLLWISVLLVTNCLSTFAQTTNQCAIQGSKLSGTVIGTTGSWNNSGNTRDKAFDGNTATYFDAPTDNPALYTFVRHSKTCPKQSVWQPISGRPFPQ